VHDIPHLLQMNAGTGQPATSPPSQFTVPVYRHQHISST